MKEALHIFENKEPEIVFSWKDHKTEAKGWVVINSLRNGASAGGTRMREGLNKAEVISLAKTMEVKFTVSGPPIGGAKSGINFNPKDPRKKEVLSRWYKAIQPILKTYYGTGGDLNVDEINEVIPLTKREGVLFPLEGVIVGHFNPDKAGYKKKINQLQIGVDKEITDLKYTPKSGNFKIGDMATGFGVSESIQHFYKIIKEPFKGKKIIIQGWGNVGSAAAYYLAQNGGKIVGVIDKAGGIINKKGFSSEEIKNLFLTKKGNRLSAENMLTFNQANNQIWNTGAEVFIPAASSRLVTKKQVNMMRSNNLELIACGANVPFADNEIFYGPIAAAADEKITVIPDFISNCGMARTFSYLMEDDIELSDKAIFEQISRCIKNAIKEVYNNNKEKTGFSKTALTIALNKLI